MNRNLFSGTIRLSRPVNVIITFFTVLVAVTLTGTVNPWQNVLLACLSASLIMAGANTVNDYFDLEIDRINKPSRVLVQNKILPAVALKIAWSEFGAGLFLAVFINTAAFLIASLAVILIFYYSFRWKRSPLFGNVVVSMISAMAFIYGGAAVQRIKFTAVPAILAFFYHFGREIIKDVQDMPGDARREARTFPLVFGKKSALRLTTFNFGLLMVILPIPYFMHLYNFRYLLMALIGVYPIIIYSVISMWKNPDAKNLGNISNLLKADMLVGLFALYIGHVNM